jgi:signal transduction histidine kinase
MSVARYDHDPGSGTVLSRLRIRQKLSLLLMIPLTAVIVTLVPFTAERIDDARSAGATARIARAAREVGTLIQNLQQERILALGFLTTPTLERSALLAQAQLAIDDVARLRGQPDTRALMQQADPRINALTPVRTRVLSRSITSTEVYGAYRDANNALLAALALTNPPGADAQGYRQLAALEALMRANEEASGAGAVAVAVAGDPTVNRTLLTDALIAQQLHTTRFRGLVTAAQADLVATVEEGKAGQRLAGLIRDLSLVANGDVNSDGVRVSDALTAAISYTGLRRLAQDRIAREIATGAGDRAKQAQLAAAGVGGAAILLLAFVIGLGVTVSRSISSPLRRLTRAAGLVAELAGSELVRVADSDDPDPAPPKLAAVDVRSNDEVGELAIALNRVQATAALLLERQVVTRRNVAVMFANIARRTQNLVGRQLSLIDDLERNERSAALLHRLYRLDHVATRLRRSADSLLVVSGTIDEGVAGVPTALADVIRSALAEIEGFSAVQLGDICDVTVSAGLVGDLRLLLAELLENAASFSPPGTPVEISALLDQECRIIIVDHGLGMAPARLEEENRRLVERERLDLAPTTALGLFVVGRLARRHRLGVRLGHSEGRGVTAMVSVPLRLLSAGAFAARPAPPAIGRRILATDPLDLEPLAIESGSDGARSRLPVPLDPQAWAALASGEPFPWFGQLDVPINGGARQEPTPSVNGAMDLSAADLPAADLPAADLPAAPAPPDPAPAWPEQRGGLNRRRPGRHLFAFGPSAEEESPTEPLPSRDPIAEREALDAFSAGVAGEHNLTRRVPGAHMTGAVRSLSESPPTVAGPRDPEAERDALSSFIEGYDRGIHAEPDQDSWDREPHLSEEAP